MKCPRCGTEAELQTARVESNGVVFSMAVCKECHRALSKALVDMLADWGNNAKTN